MCGMDNFDYQNSNEELRRPEKVPTKPKKNQSSDDDLIKPVKPRFSVFGLSRFLW
jgi:hypothetical protein